MAVLIYIENWEGQFKKLTYELASFGASLAEKAGVELVALSIGSVGDEELMKLGTYGVNRVVQVNDPDLAQLDNRAYTRIIAEVVESVDATVVLFAHNNTGKGLAPRVAARLEGGLGTGLVALPDTLDPLIIRKKVFSGKAFADVQIEGTRKVLTLSQNAYELIEKPVEIALESFKPEGEIAVATQVTEVNKQSGKIILTDAEVVVSGGRGMRGPENWPPLEELADVLGAATACSRPVSDEGWRPHEEHTGQTGKIIAPNLYMAFGISGAIQHLAGVSSSKCIVAVNNDPDAPIFEAADYGIIGDASKVLPELVQAIREVKGK